MKQPKAICNSLSKYVVNMMLYILFALSFISDGCKESRGASVLSVIKSDSLVIDTLPSWMIGPFVKLDNVNPCLISSQTQLFRCPVRNHIVQWEEKDVFNPAIIAHNGVLHLIYRAEDSIGRHAGTSRLGLAQSKDGLHFDKFPEPVFYPDRDQMFQYEWEGGCEDPRIVRRPDGLYVMTYTAYDGEIARLCIASSKDLHNWTKHGLAFAKHLDGRYVDLWSKSGAVISKYDTTGSISARMINGKYWMYWGDKDIHLATSPDLLVWSPVVDSIGALMRVLSPRLGMFDSDLVEPGPPAMITDEGILLLYNGRNFGEQRDTMVMEGTYSAGQVLFDLKDPTRLLKRSDKAFFVPDRSYEIEGQINRVVFIEGLVRWKSQWLMYYGTADSRIAVARAK